jgi:hypothetical protein
LEILGSYLRVCPPYYPFAAGISAINSKLCSRNWLRKSPTDGEPSSIGKDIPEVKFPGSIVKIALPFRKYVYLDRE